MEYFAIAFFVIIAAVIFFKRSPKPTTTAVVGEPTEAELAVGTTPTAEPAPVVETAPAVEATVEIVPAGTEASVAAPAKKPRAKKAEGTTAKKPRAKKAAE